ncbi:hypothetical protein B4U80_15038 [Leptotrombidium deliense]|uniref:Peptidase S1 domain-containing protein n=1 Tax=Leptotrombidium deliense TaxID=299467 RepID=A0A443RSN7_9ACAR|nr:hypothetical protein B4U80_15038 [Leptotrombidium deliense]
MQTQKRKSFASECMTVEGDSGGPMVVKRNKKMVQIGVATAVSFTGCGDRQNLYNSVASHRAWIKEVSDV